VQELLDRLGQIALVVGGRLLLVAIYVLVLVVLYRLVIGIVQRVARRAAATPLPGEEELPDEERAIRRATRSRRLDTLVLVTTRLGR